MNWDSERDMARDVRENNDLYDALTMDDGYTFYEMLYGSARSEIDHCGRFPRATSRKHSRL